jgi:nicotinate phosphoribosyltransferase
MVLAAGGRPLIDFGLRRAHGAEAGLLAARASYLAGFAGTATLLAAQRFAVPCFGTMAHSFVQAHADEAEAFERFARARPDAPVLLIDTYDTEAGAEKVVRLAPKLKAAGIELRGVRIDSGDLGAHARKVRRILDLGGLQSVAIVASGGLDELKIQCLIEAGAPIDSFGVGTSLATSEDAPALDCAYKLQQYRGVPRRKKSEGKVTWPGCKQVHRRTSGDGTLLADVVSRVDEPCEGAPLMEPVLRGGSLIRPLPSLEAARTRAAAQLAMLPSHLKELRGGARYEVQISTGLHELARELDALSGR